MSSKPKKVIFSKSLVRNPKQTVLPKTKVLKTSKADIPLLSINGKNVGQCKPLPERLIPKPITKDINPSPSPAEHHSRVTKKFDVPEIHSSLKIGKKIEQIQSAKSAKVKVVPYSEKRTFEDKITKYVNFPYEKSIYKGLIPLSSPNRELPLGSQLATSSREPRPARDEEPVLSNFTEHRVLSECSYMPNVKVEPRKTRYQHNNLKLYKVMQIYNEKLL